MVATWRATLCRILAIAVFSLWWGGFTFYSLVVIPIGQEVLRSHVKVGFITEKVTHQLNVIGLFTLSALLWNLLSAWRTSRPPLRLGLAGTWLVLAALLGVLFVLHPQLQRLLDHPAREVVDEPRFYGLHRVYHIVTTVQWLAALVHVFLALSEWRRRDSGEGTRATGGAT